MRLVIIRHADAALLGEPGITTDEARPLTELGIRQCQPLARSLERLGLRPERLLSSPLVRARQTAEQLLSVWGQSGLAIEECLALAPGGKKRAIVQAINSKSSECLALVGHNPDVSELIGWFLGDKNVAIDLEKAGVACLEFEDCPDKGNGTLRWLVTPEWCGHLAG
jgi:phosphohistidine phosphatase